MTEREKKLLRHVRFGRMARRNHAAADHEHDLDHQHYALHADDYKRQQHHPLAAAPGYDDHPHQDEHEHEDDGYDFAPLVHPQYRRPAPGDDGVGGSVSKRPRV